MLESTRQNTKPWNSPSIWMGCTLPGWLALLARNSFSVSRENVPLAAAVTGMSVLNSGLGLAERALFARRIRETKIDPSPVFIIGHWRTGTTFLHELLALDVRHTVPSTYECFIPNHFLLTEDYALKNLSHLLPPTRPMDNMRVGLDRPFEDEFALLNMGLPSPYQHLAFPTNPRHADYMSLTHLSPRERARWKRRVERFFKRVLIRRPGRLVLKTPAHTCRIPLLLEMFPNARFVHTVRHPYDVYPSIMNLWRKVCGLFSLGETDFSDLEEFVFQLFDLLYRRLEETQGLVPKSNFIEVRYEDLTARPQQELVRIYRGLSLGSIEPALPAVRDHLDGLRDYRRNRFDLPALTRERIDKRWGWVMEKYDYTPENWQPHDRRDADDRRATE